MARDPRQGTQERDDAARTPAESTEQEEHYRRRMDEVGPELGRRGRWGYLFWVILWVAVLAAVVIVYAIAGRAI